MANICVYKAIVKGKKDACYAFYWSMSVLDGISIKEKGGSDDDYMIRFEGDCKWTVDQYCKPWEGSFDIDIPATREEALKYQEITVQERSLLFKVEVLCNSADIEEANYELFEHYIAGERLHSGGCPEELKVLDDPLGVSIKCDDDCYGAVISLLEEITDDYDLYMVTINEQSADNTVVIEDIQLDDVPGVLAGLIRKLAEYNTDFSIEGEVPEFFRFTAIRSGDKLTVTRVDITKKKPKEVKAEYELDDDSNYDELYEDIDCFLDA
jgi:hypothetical protein